MKEIELLDGNLYNIEEVEKKMLDDSFYYGELNKLALSSSSLKQITESPKKYYYINKYGSKQTPAMVNGWLLHTLILEPEKWDSFQFIDCLSTTSKKYKLAKEEYEFTFTMKQKTDAERLADAILKNEEALKCLSNSEYEVPVIGEVLGMPFRGKADILSKGGICDIKTSQNIKGFHISADSFGYDIQVFLYCELFNFNYYDFKFLVIDKGSLDVGVYEVTEEFFESGRRKVEYGIKQYKEFFYQKNEDEIESNINNYIIRGIL